MEIALIPRLYTAKEVAEQISVSESWVLEHVPSIKLHGLRRFHEDQVKAWLEAQDEGLAEVRQIRSVS
jgi:hypothetical protein